MKDPVVAVPLCVTPGAPGTLLSPLTLSEANLLVAMLAGYWGRKGDGPPGPDVMGRGLLILNALVEWQKIANAIAPTKPSAKKIPDHGIAKHRPHFHG